MTKLPNQQFQQLVPKMREKGFYPPQEQRAISWPDYTLSQIEEARETLAFIRDSVDRTCYLDVKGKTGRPLTDPKELAKAVLMCEAFDFTERSAQGWVEILGPFAGMRASPDDRTIGDAYERMEVLFILYQVFEETKESDGRLSGDGTGLETSRKQNYESGKKTGEYMTSIVDSREVVQAFDVSGDGECTAMHSLIKEVSGRSLCLDAGFNCRKLVKEIVQLGMRPFVFPMKSNILNGALAWKSMYLDLLRNVIAWLIEYHQRSHTESFHSSFKRRNSIITKRRQFSRLTQITARIIVHNRRRLAYFRRLSGTG
jgi:transposase